MSAVEAIAASALAEELASAAGKWPCRPWALLDIREAGEAEAGHIPSATPLPRRMLEFRIGDLVPNRSTPITLYDGGGAGPYGSDNRACLAASTLARAGYRTLRILTGGLAAWRRVGLVARGVNVPCKAFGERVLAEDRIAYVGPSELAEQIHAGDRVAVCDVRTLEEYFHHHLPQGFATPGFDLALHLPDLTRGYDRVVINCAGRTRSIIATATAARLGLAERVVALENGTMGWRLAALEVEQGAGRSLPPPSPEGSALVVERAKALAEGVGVGLLPPGGLVSALAEGPLPYVFDLRSLADYQGGHIAASVALPGGQAVQRADDFAAAPGNPVVFVDAGDARAFLAAYWFRRMGFPRVEVLQGGIPAWVEAGYAMVFGRAHRAPLGLAEARARVSLVAPDRLRHRIGAGEPIRVIDVGTSRRFAAGHLPGAVWLPRGWLEVGIPKHAEPSDPVVIVAHEEAQAILAADTLADRGYRRVTVLAGGTGAWEHGGGVLETGLPENQAAPQDVVDPPYQKGAQAMRDYLDWEVRLVGE